MASQVEVNRFDDSTSQFVSDFVFARKDLTQDQLKLVQCSTCTRMYQLDCIGCCTQETVIALM